jgi:hypothetical protein
VNNETVAIESAAMDTDNSRVLIINLVSNLYYQDIIAVSYSGSTITSVYNSSLNSFLELSVCNNLIARLQIPGKIEAEDFSNQVGVELENTSDTGAGKNIGYTDRGDYMEYLIFVRNSGNYNLDIRSSAKWDSAKIEFQLINKDEEERVSVVDLPVTGDWQNWQTTSVPTTLNEGVYTLKVKVLSGGFNMNWFAFNFLSGLNVNSFITNSLTISPNPVLEEFHIKLNNQQSINNIKIIDINGRTVKKMQPNERAGVYEMSNLKPGVYFLLLDTENGSYQRKLIKN